MRLVGFRVPFLMISPPLRIFQRLLRGRCVFLVFLYSFSLGLILNYAYFTSRKLVIVKRRGGMTVTSGTLALVVAGAAVVHTFGKVIYNLLFHPLRHYPGPILWRASPVPKAIHILLGTYAKKTIEFHDQYGTSIRVAPSELSYIQAQAWKDIFGRPLRNELAKDMRTLGAKIHDGYGIITAPAEDHARIRRLFGPAFSSSALRQQERLLVKYIDLLIDKLDVVRMQGEEKDGGGGGGTVNLVDKLNLAAFDIMAELTFGETLDLLEDGRNVPWVHAIFDGLKFIVWRAVLLGVPVLGPLLELLTTGPLKKMMKKHCRLSEDMVDRRLAWKVDTKPDIWSFVLRHQDSEVGSGGGSQLTLQEMYANAAMFLIAGSETTSTSLSGVFFYLMTNPRVYRLLTAEIRSTFRSSEDINIQTVSNMSYLNAVLQEGLRIYTPGGVGIGRFVQRGGAEICGDYIPEGTLVSLNSHAASTSSTNFYRPREFIPERWLYPDQEPFRNDKREVHEPFSYGPRNCIGKNLAWLEMRLLLSKILWHFDLDMCDESTNWLDQKSYLTWEKGPLMAKLTCAQHLPHEVANA